MANPIAMTYPDTPERDIESAAKLRAQAFSRIRPYESKPVVLVPAEAWRAFEFRVVSGAEMMARMRADQPSPGTIVVGGIEFRREE